MYKKLLNFVKKYLELFCEKGAIHGINFLALNIHYVEKLCWLGLLIASMYFCVNFGIESWDRYQYRSTVVTIENDHYYWNSTLPALTVCPMNRISQLKFDEYCDLYNIDGQEKEEFYEFILSLANSTYINFNNIKNFSSVDKMNIKPSNYMSLIYSLTDDMTKATTDYKVRSVNNLEYIASMQTLTEFGICYTTNSYVAPYLTVRQLLFNLPLEEDPYYKTEVVHDVKVGNLFDEHITYTFLGFEAQTITFIHSAHDVMNPSKKFLYTDDAIEFKAYSVEIVADDDFRKSTTVAQRGCRFTTESNLTHFDIYTAGLCTQECRLILAYKHCGCIPHFYPNRIAKPKPVCSYHVLKTCFPPKQEIFLNFHNEATGENIECECLPNCADSIIIIQQTQLLKGTRGLLGNTASLVAIKQFATYRFVRRVLFTFTDFLVSIGGTAGLLLGFCVLGAVEILYFFTIRLFWFIKGRQLQ